MAGAAMSKVIYAYSGEAPTVVESQNVEKILNVMLEQLKILNQLALGFVLVPEGTKITREDKCQKI